MILRLERMVLAEEALTRVGKRGMEDSETNKDIIFFFFEFKWTVLDRNWGTGLDFCK